MIRNFIDYHIYLFKIQKKETISFWTDMFLFCISCIATIKEWNNLFSSFTLRWAVIALILVSFLKFAWDLMSSIDQIKQWLDLRYSELFNEEIDPAEVLPSQIENKLEYERIECEIRPNIKDYVFNSEKIDTYLRDNNLKLIECKHMENKIRYFIKNNKSQLIPFLKWQYRISKFYGKAFFNESKLCISNDIKIGEQISCHKGCYYDTFLTNIICGKQLKSNKDNSIIADATSFFPADYINNNWVMHDITTAVVNNEIGVSTIALTKDNYLILWNQNRSAQSSNGLLVPTGSGSCDWNDITEWDFNKTITNAMQRELWEESGKKNLANSYNEIGKTMLLGYFRWIIKGGKPEFVGITKLNVEYNALKSEEKEVYGGHKILINEVNDIPESINKIKSLGNISVPLHMTLFCLNRYYNNSKDQLKEFLFTEN